MADETADALREMALHRGFKLVRSRRRKPGTGDFGKFGLTDDAGKPLLGIGDDGLTASASEIEDYLRAGATSTWAQSAELTPNRKADPASDRRRKPSRPQVRDEPEAPIGERSKGAVSKGSKGTAPAERAPPPLRQTRKPAPKAAPEPSDPPARAKPRPAQAPPPPEPEPEPELALRTAKPSDAAALAKLLGQLSGIRLSEHEAARYLAGVRKHGGGADVAAVGKVVGCVAWAVVPTLQRGPVGRITVLVVDDRHRRQGIGKALLARAETDLAKKGCALVEAMSDTDLKNSHGFFRTLGFEQKSYRFVRSLTRG